MRNKVILTAVAMGAALTSTVVLEGEARACGGCFSQPPTPTETPTIVTDHRMILTISKEQSTLYDQIKYQGSPSAFAWVLPISGTVDVGLSSDIVFQALDGSTTTEIIAPPRNCPPPPTCNPRNSGGFGSTSADNAGSPSAAADAGTAPPPVVVTKQEVVGPYETVQLKATDANALENWLSQNGFYIPTDVKPVVDKYVTEKFDFLALKLLPGKGVTDMRPVRVTTKGAAAVLPLRMVAAGTGATVGVSLWVLGEGRYEPQNFPSFAIPVTDISWDWTQNRSDYTDIRAEKSAAANGRGWEVESSTTLYPQQIQSAVTGGYGKGYPYPTPASPDGGAPLDPQEAQAQLNYAPITDAQGNVTKTAVQVRDEDMKALFYGIASAASRVTRMRSDLAHAALDADLVMTASQDQSTLSNVRQVTKELNEPLCPVYSADGCSQVGQAPRSEAQARAGSAEESFSCSVGTANGSSAWLGAGLGYLAIAIVRLRRRFRE
jgi:hypothetical protein